MTTATVQVSLTEFLSTVLQGLAAGVSADSYDPPKLMLLGDGGAALGLFTFCLHQRHGERSVCFLAENRLCFRLDPQRTV